MSIAVEQSSACPFHTNRDDRKTAQITALQAKPEKGAKMVDGYLLARDILRSAGMKQGGGGVELIETTSSWSR